MSKIIPFPPAEPVEDAVPAPLLAVIALFAEHLGKLAFPDLDLALLRAQADEIRTAAAAATEARRALAAAEATLSARTTALEETAARGLAYVRIYADAHPERDALAAALAAITAHAPIPASSRLLAGAAPTSASAPRRRGRPRKVAPELALETPAAPPAEDLVG